MNRDPVMPISPHVAPASGRSADSDSCYLKMRGLPFSVVPDKVFEFFSGLHVLNQVSLIYNPAGMPTGEAIVGFGSLEERERAMARNRQMLDGRHITLYRLSAMEAITSMGLNLGVLDYAQVAPEQGQGVGSGSGHPMSREEHLRPAGTSAQAEGEQELEGSCTVRMRGLPYKCSPVEIADFFSNYEIVENGIVIGTDRLGRASGRPCQDGALLTCVDSDHEMCNLPLNCCR